MMNLDKSIAKKYWRHLLFLGILIASSTQLAFAQAANSVNIYSARQENLIRPILDQFTKETSIQVNLVTGKADVLLNRLETEGAKSPVDLFITVDAGRLYLAQSKGLFHCLTTAQAKRLQQRIPAEYRDPQNCWFGLSLRSRVILVNKQRVQTHDISTYESLGNARWKNNICIRSSSNVYNQSLVASLLAVQGVPETSAWLKRFVNNFARPPQGGDRDQILAAANGACDIAVANTYYYALMMNSRNHEQRSAAQKMRVIFPNQNNRGAHINASGAGISKHAPHFDNALRLLEYLSSPSAQKWYSEVNYEYPVVKGVPVADTLKQLGEFKKDTVNLHKVGKLSMEAFKLMQKAGWK
ncbi:MAG: Fe(3+) ABC transporter substrate-binding protein [Candidatus Oxydemutatoraceae bacterium WSBS_2016_MAG_OTU14]